MGQIGVSQNVFGQNATERGVERHTLQRKRRGLFKDDADCFGDGNHVGREFYQSRGEAWLIGEELTWMDRMSRMEEMMNAE